MVFPMSNTGNMTLKEYVSAFINTLLVTLKNSLQNLHDFIRKYNPFPESKTLEKEAVFQSCSIYSGSGLSYLHIVILFAMFSISTALAAHKWKHWRELFDTFAVGSMIYTMFSLKKYIFAAIDSIISSIQAEDDRNVQSFDDLEILLKTLFVVKSAFQSFSSCPTCLRNSVQSSGKLTGFLSERNLSNLEEKLKNAVDAIHFHQRARTLMKLKRPGMLDKSTQVNLTEDGFKDDSYDFYTRSIVDSEKPCIVGDCTNKNSELQEIPESQNEATGKCAAVTQGNVLSIQIEFDRYLRLL